MIRSIEYWWVLYKLQEATTRPIEGMTPNLRLGNSPHNQRGEFVEWLADISIGTSGWLYRPFRVGPYRIKRMASFNKQDQEKLRKLIKDKRLELYNSLVDSCIINQYIKTLGNGEQEAPGLKFLHTTPQGDDFIAGYWWKHTIGSQIMTAVIIAALIWFTTYRLERLFSPKENGIYKIQIVPNSTPE